MYWQLLKSAKTNFTVLGLMSNVLIVFSVTNVEEKINKKAIYAIHFDFTFLKLGNFLFKPFSS